MSRHHVTLPPIVYTPVPKPKVARRRPAVGRLSKFGAKADVDDVEETEETADIRPMIGQQVAPIAGRSQDDPSGSSMPERKAPSTSGRLSDTTLRALLLVQERTA